LIANAIYGFAVVLPQLSILALSYTIWGLIVGWHFGSQILATVTDPKADTVSYKDQGTFVRTASNNHVITYVNDKIILT